MKLFISSLLLISSLSFARTSKIHQQKAGSSPNAVTQGTHAHEKSDSSSRNMTDEERELEREEASSMGGAPNAGAGTGTGTGAGSTIGHPMGNGTVTAGPTTGSDLD